MPNKPEPDPELSELEAVAAKYTDRPAELVADLRGRLLDDIAYGLELIGIRGGLVDLLRLAADDNHTPAGHDTEGTSQ